MARAGTREKRSSEAGQDLTTISTTSSNGATQTTIVNNTFTASTLFILFQPTSEKGQESQEEKVTRRSGKEKTQAYLLPSQPHTSIHPLQTGARSILTGVQLLGWILGFIWVRQYTNHKQAGILVPFGCPLGQSGHVEDSNLTNKHLLQLLSPQSWWQSPGWVPAPLPAPCLPSAWLFSNMAPPSPVYCDGCQRVTCSK